MLNKLTIELDNKLLFHTAQYFGYKNKQTNYSELFEKLMLYFLNNQALLEKKRISDIEKNISELLIEPEINIKTIENNTNFELSSVEGQWPGDESLDLLLNMIKHEKS